MNMLGEQIKGLREKADMLDGLEGMDNLVSMLREAADTIEGLRAEIDGPKCYATQANYEHCKYSTNRGWCDTSRYAELFGTPEKAARTMQPDSMSCKYCLLRDYCKDGICLIDDYDALLEWLRGDAE